MAVARSISRDTMEKVLFVGCIFSRWKMVAFSGKDGTVHLWNPKRRIENSSSKLTERRSFSFGISKGE